MLGDVSFLKSNNYILRVTILYIKCIPVPPLRDFRIPSIYYAFVTAIVACSHPPDPNRENKYADKNLHLLTATSIFF